MLDIFDEFSDESFHPPRCCFVVFENGEGKRHGAFFVQAQGGSESRIIRLDADFWYLSDANAHLIQLIRLGTYIPQSQIQEVMLDIAYSELTEYRNESATRRRIDEVRKETRGDKKRCAGTPHQAFSQEQRRLSLSMIDVMFSFFLGILFALSLFKREKK